MRPKHDRQKNLLSELLSIAEQSIVFVSNRKHTGTDARIVGIIFCICNLSGGFSDFVSAAIYIYIYWVDFPIFPYDSVRKLSFRSFPIFLYKCMGDCVHFCLLPHKVLSSACSAKIKHGNCRVPCSDREVAHGVGADGVGVKFPFFAVNCSCSPLSSSRMREKRRKTKKNGEKRRKTKKNEEKRKKTKKRRKTKKNVKNGKIPPTPSTPTPLRTSQSE